MLLATYETMRNRTIRGHTRDRKKKVCERREYSFTAYRKDISSRKWDVNKNILETKVRTHQMKLVELASETGSTSDTRVLKFQRQLALKKEFRMLAVQKVLTNKGHKTPGVDKMLIERDEEK